MIFEILNPFLCSHQTLIMGGKRRIARKVIEVTVEVTTGNFSESCILRLPEAAFRGFAKGSSSSSIRFRLMFSKLFLRRMILHGFQKMRKIIALQPERNALDSTNICGYVIAL